MMAAVAGMMVTANAGLDTKQGRQTVGGLIQPNKGSDGHVQCVPSSNGDERPLDPFGVAAASVQCRRDLRVHGLRLLRLGVRSVDARDRPGKRHLRAPLCGRARPLASD